MDQDGLKKQINHISDIIYLKEYLEKTKQSHIIFDKVNILMPLLYKVNYDLISIYYDNLVEEFELIFFNIKDNNSGRFSIIIRDYNSKIYLFGLKYLSEDLKINIDNTLYEIIEMILQGSYYITEISSKNKIIERRVEFMHTIKKIEFGLFNFLKRNVSINKYTGENLIKPEI